MNSDVLILIAMVASLIAVVGYVALRVVKYVMNKWSL